VVLGWRSVRLAVTVVFDEPVACVGVITEVEPPPAATTEASVSYRIDRAEVLLPFAFTMAPTVADDSVMFVAVDVVTVGPLVLKDRVAPFVVPTEFVAATRK
jgi:hypothetical protein